MDYATALRICRLRAEAMAACTREARARYPGREYGMVALVCEPERLASLIETVEAFLAQSGVAGGWEEKGDGDGADGETGLKPLGPAIGAVLIANVNSKNQIVLSGDLERIAALLVQLRQFGGHDPRAVRLNADSPFHSPVMGPARDRMVALLAGVPIAWAGSVPCVSNVSARPFRDVRELKDQLARQCVETVRWWDSIRWADQEFGVRRWVGIGPGLVGRNLVGKEVGMRGREGVRGGGVWGVSEPADVEVMLRGLEETEGWGGDG